MTLLVINSLQSGFIALDGHSIYITTTVSFPLSVFRLFPFAVGFKYKGNSLSVYTIFTNRILKYHSIVLWTAFYTLECTEFISEKLHSASTVVVIMSSCFLMLSIVHIKLYVKMEVGGICPSLECILAMWHVYTLINSTLTQGTIN